MSEAKRPAAPRSLDAPGRAFWRSVMADYELSPAEVEILRQCCRVVDVLARLDVELIEADGLTVEGSTGQPRAHPALSASADQRRVLESLVRSLALPMPDEVQGRRRTPAAREAAQERWRQQKAERARG